MNLQLQPQVRPMGAADLEQVLAWRNHREIRRYMYNQHEISLDEHARWFGRVSQDPKRHLLIFESDAMPLGFISINQLGEGGVADWGFYVAPDAPKGTGSDLGRVTLDYAFNQVGLHKLCGQTLAFNERSIRFHLKLGFHQEGILRQQHFDGLNYHDVACFGLLAGEWQANSER